MTSLRVMLCGLNKKLISILIIFYHDNEMINLQITQWFWIRVDPPDSDTVMMRGGPRMMCSPYLTGSLAIMLVIVAFNYWTVAAENSELSKKLQDMQQQLKSGTSHIKNLEEEIAQVRMKQMSMNSNVTAQKSFTGPKSRE